MKSQNLVSNRDIVIDNSDSKTFLKNNLTELYNYHNNKNFSFINNKNLLKKIEDDFKQLNTQEINNVILTRIIVSAISCLACFICIIIYFYLCIRRNIENKNEIKQKAKMMDKFENGEDIDEFDEEDDDNKKEKFLTYQDNEANDYINKNLRTTLLTKKENSEGISFENVIAQNKSVSFDKNVYNPYSSNQTSNENYLLNSNDKTQIFNPYEKEDSSAYRMSNASNTQNRLNNSNFKMLNSKENLQTDIVNHYITYPTLAINNEEKGLFNNNAIKSNQNSIQENDSEDSNNPNDCDSVSHSCDSKPTVNIESKEDKKIKIGIINKILLLLIFTNLGFAICSFFVTDADGLGINDENKISPLCIPQALLQNFFDLSSICFTTVISQLMRCSQRYIILKKLTKMYKWYLAYSIIVPLAISFGPYFTESYGPNGPWCWIDTYDKNDGANIFWSYITYFFCWANIFVIIYKFYKLISYFNSRTEEIKFNQNKIEERKYIKKSKYIMYAFPIILIVSKLPATINRCIVIMLGLNNPYLYHFQAAFSSSIGLFNSIVFIYIHRRFIIKKQ